MFEFLNKLFGSKSDRDVKSMMPYIEEIHKITEELKNLSNDELRERSNNLKLRIKEYIKEEADEIKSLKESIEKNPDVSNEEKLTTYKEIERLEKVETKKIEEVLLEILPEAFAIVKETAKRYVENDYLEVTSTQYDRDLSIVKQNVKIVNDKAQYHNTWTAGGNMVKWDMVHYDVQLIGGIALHLGKISEMATGEGKTLVATLAVFLNALTGRGVHIVTVNDYLAKRDSEWMGPLYEFHQLTVDCIDKHNPHSDERKKAYMADITFGTNNEFGFDYLRDNTAISPDEIVQRVHNYAIVDEVDSVLIDDARTPLIISGPTPMGDKHEFYELKVQVDKLYNAQKALRKITSEKSIKDWEKEAGKLLLRASRGLPKNKVTIKILSEAGNRTLMQKTENFYMQDQNKQMPVIDDDLFFVIDEKVNSIEMTDKGIDLITAATDEPNFFIIPDVGSEIADLEKNTTMSAHEKLKHKEELLRDFSLKSGRIHTVNQLLKAYAMFEKDVEYVIMDNQIRIVDEQTGRVLEGRRYSDGLHQAIEAKENVKVEAATQTYATISLQNYFRMYKKLAGMTGTAETEAGEFWDIYKLDVVVIPTNKPLVRKDSEDKVFRTKREKYKAVIEEIESIVKANRPVLVGTTSVEVSELLSKMLKLKGIKHNVLNAKLHKREADIVAEAGQAKTVTIATNMAGRGTDIKLGEGVKNAGGLAIIGTERHESRRVDRQLRGRAGRQGDPGSSLFFVSLEDELMRLFGSERMAKIMDRLGLKEGEVIQHSMITKSIERAQRKVEENNFGMRKRLLEYDDVMNTQREVIYNKRRNALYGEKLSIDIENVIKDICLEIIAETKEYRDLDAFKIEVLRMFGVNYEIESDDFFNIKTDVLTQSVFEAAYENYIQKKQIISERAFPFIKNVYENNSQQYKNIVFPITDGTKVLQVVCNLEKSYTSKGKELVIEYEKTINLAVIDEEWREHLRELDDLKQSVHNASYEQKDPLLIYKLESFNLFKTMISKINRNVISFLYKADIPIEESKTVKDAPIKKVDHSKLTTSRANDLVANTAPQEEKRQPIIAEKKVGRNDLCPCGSGKKYKHCHGQ